MGDTVIITEHSFFFSTCWERIFNVFEIVYTPAMTALLSATLIAAVFIGSTVLAVIGKALSARGRPIAVAVAAAILLVIAFGDLFPESLELAGNGAIVAFLAAFGTLFLIESWTRAHVHHAPSEAVHVHGRLPFLLGMALHNLADGFAIGISATLRGSEGAAVSFGVLVHQIPVGVSFAAVLLATHIPHAAMLRNALLIGLLIPLATLLTLALPPLSDRLLGVLIGGVGGMLAYISTTHLLPEAQTEHPSRTVGVVFAATLALMTLALFTMLAE